MLKQFAREHGFKFLEVQLEEIEGVVLHQSGVNVFVFEDEDPFSEETIYLFFRCVWKDGFINDVITPEFYRCLESEFKPEKFYQGLKETR